MTEMEQICIELRGKSSLELVGKLLNLKRESLYSTLLTQTDKEKVWEFKIQINLIDSLIREIASKSNKD